MFNYLFSRHHGGEFLLRIEDTDRERSTEEATRGILASLDWLGLERDGPPVFQSTRTGRHAEVAWQLLEAGHAYKCYCTPEELAREREQARAEGRNWRYDGRWRDRDPASAPTGVKPVIRLKAPRDGDTVVHDLVQGTVRVANAELDDMIILRGDGTPTYNHSVVVDDFDMGISHVIRGDDHLTNTFRQVQIYRAMGWEPPRFAHLPLIHGPDGSKLSKRHGAQLTGVPRAGLPIPGFMQLPATPWLGAWRSGGDRPRGGDPPVRSRRRGPGTESHGLCQAEPPQRHLYTWRRRGLADARGARAAGASPWAWRLAATPPSGFGR